MKKKEYEKEERCQGTESFDESFLLLDDHIVKSAEGCRQIFYGAFKDPSNPVICATEPWEGKGPYTWGTRILWNDETKEYDFYYVAFRVEDNHYRWGLMTSDDGLEWEKPKLFIETFNGKPALNMLTGGPHPDKAVRSVVKDPRPECAPEERYKAIRFTYDGEYVSYSKDGRLWHEYPENPVWHVPSDIIHAMWDPKRSCFTAYYKVWEITGDTPDPSSPSGYRKIKLHAPTFKHEQIDDHHTQIEGPIIDFLPGRKAEVTYRSVVLRSGSQGIDDGGGCPLTGLWHTRRVIARAESNDWLDWTNESVVLEYDEQDHPSSNIQYMFVCYYGGYYLGFLTMHDDRGHFEQQFAFSRDGIKWSRPWRGNFLGLGSPGAFDSGMVLAVTDPIIKDNSMIFYYGGFDILHHQSMDSKWASSIGRAFLRKDGFAAWENTGSNQGVIITQKVVVSKDQLRINADAGDGEIKVEILDEKQCLIEGFEADLCEDTMQFESCMKSITWTSGNSLKSIEGQSVHLKFYIKNARLFAFDV
jgi:hypothetical protein